MQGSGTTAWCLARRQPLRLGAGQVLTTFVRCHPTNPWGTYAFADMGHDFSQKIRVYTDLRRFR